jgi:NADPH:quinone reductase-like Zn-dependent oxidoreductase
MARGATVGAALVYSYDHPPRYGETPEPVAGSGEVVVDMLAAALHPLVKGRASGRHYSSANAVLPVVPGVDGVGRRPDGTLVFCTAFASGGTMAQRVAVAESDCIPLPAGADPAVIAAAMNPAMSGWLAMRTRAALRAGERVLVLGATGAAGRAAVALAGHLGATVVAAGRNAEVLAGLGADVTVSLEPAPGVTDPDPVAAVLAEHGAEVDVVVDYLWGQQTERVLASVLGGSRDPAKPLRWVQVSATAGPDITLPGALLRSSALQLTGSGLGSVSPARMAAELAELLVVLLGLPPTTTPELTPLADVERAWTTEPATGHRIVFVP